MKSFIVTLTLTGLCAWLGWTAYEESRRPLPTLDSRSDSAESGSGQTPDRPNRNGTTLEFPPLEELDEIVARPLFNVSRRPIVPEESPEPVAEPTDLNVMLSGIVIGQSRQIAHLRSMTEKETLALSVGDEIDGWKIQSIFPDHVVLKSGSRVETLYMQKPGVSPPAASPSRTRGPRPVSRPPTARQRARQNRLRNRRGGTQ